MRKSRDRLSGLLEAKKIRQRNLVQDADWHKRAQMIAIEGNNPWEHERHEMAIREIERKLGRQL